MRGQRASGVPLPAIDNMEASQRGRRPSQHREAILQRGDAIKTTRKWSVQRFACRDTTLDSAPKPPDGASQTSRTILNYR